MIKKNKVLSILKENLLFFKRENYLLIPFTLYTLLIIAYIYLWPKIFIQDFIEINYINILSSSQYFIWIIIMVYLWINSIQRDIDSKTIYISLQYVNKKEYIIWKLWSVIVLSWIINFIFWFTFFVWYYYLFNNVDLSLSYIFLFQLLEFNFIAFLSIFISIILKTNISKILTILLLLILWHTMYPLKVMIENQYINISEWLQHVFYVIYNVIPNLESFNAKNVILFNNNLWFDFLKSFLYCFILCFILYIFSEIKLKKKDF
jgi:hypothetical protein